jgi:hypothetical protein
VVDAISVPTAAVILGIQELHQAFSISRTARAFRSAASHPDRTQVEMPLHPRQVCMKIRQPSRTGNRPRSSGAGYCAGASHRDGQSKQSSLPRDRRFFGFVFLTHNLLVWTKAVLFAGTRLVAAHTRGMVEKIIRVPAFLVRHRGGLRLELPAAGVLAGELRDALSPTATQLSLPYSHL